MSEDRKIKLTIFRCTLTQGGADRVAVTLMQSLPPERYDITLLMLRREGELLGEVPPHVRIVALDVRALRNALRPMIDYLRRESPDVVLSLDSGGNVPLAMAHAWLRGRWRLILSERNILFNGGVSLNRLWQVAAKCVLYRLADTVVAVANDQARELRNLLLLPKQRVVTIYNPIVTDRLFELAQQPCEEFGFGGHTETVLAVGRLVPQKDYPTLLKAFAEVRRKRAQVRLVVLGEGAEKDKLQRLAREMGIADDVVFAGFQANPYRFMANSDVYVLSSRNEGLPGTLIQAMACGVPAISTDCPTGPSEIIRHGTTGLLVPVGDHQAIADAIIEVLDHRDRFRQVARDARSSVVEQFSALPIVAAYERLLAPGQALR